MMGVTSPNSLPFPEYVDPPDVPYYIKALAEAIETQFSTAAEVAAVYRTIADSYTKAQVDAAIDARVVPVITGGTKLHFGTFYGTPAAGGKLVVTHGAGFTPDQVYATAADTDAKVQASKGIVCNVLTDEIGASNFSVRLYRNDDATSYESATRIVFVCRKN